MSGTTRRQLITASTTVAAASAIAEPAIASPAARGPEQPLRVARGKSRNGAPLKIQGADFVATKVAGRDVDGRYALIALNTPPGRGPELHIHPDQNEWFYLLDGRIGMRCGDQRLVLGQGDSFLVPAGMPHAYVTLGESTAHLLNLFDPAGEIEAFFAEYSSVLNRPGPPDAGLLAKTYERHGMKVVGAPLRPEEFAADA